MKICGICSQADARVAVESGVDAIGLVFYPPSPRAVTPGQAADIVAAVPPFVTVTALFVDQPPQEIEAILQQVSIDLLQFHGDESPELCARFGRPYIKAVRMRPGIDLLELRERYRAARGLLLDSYQPGVPGGTGQAFDWRRIPEQIRSEIVLAGGLAPDNVCEAIQEVQPFGVDVSGGVERAKGVKDPEKIMAFMRGVERADQ